MTVSPIKRKALQRNWCMICAHHTAPRLSKSNSFNTPKLHYKRQPHLFLCSIQQFHKILKTLKEERMIQRGMVYMFVKGSHHFSNHRVGIEFKEVLNPLGQTCWTWSFNFHQNTCEVNLLAGMIFRFQNTYTNISNYWQQFVPIEMKLFIATLELMSQESTPS